MPFRAEIEVTEATIGRSLNPYCRWMPFRALKNELYVARNENGLNPYCRWMPFRASVDEYLNIRKQQVLILIVGGCPFGPDGHGGAHRVGAGACLNPYCRWMPFRATPK